MKTFGIIMGCLGAFGLSAAGCGGAKQSAGNASKKAELRTIKGSLKGLSGPTAVGAKTRDGKTLKAVIDPKSDSFALNLPRNKAAVITIKSGSTLKKLKFAQSRIGAQADGASDPWSFEIPDDAFESDCDLGTVDFGDDVGDEILLGDDPGEHSVWEFVDSDDDGEVDFADADDDGDGTDDLDDTDWIDDDNWVDAELDDAGDWDFFEADDFCALDDDDVCFPEDDEFVTEDECGDADIGEDWCYFEGEDGYYEADAGEEDDFAWDMPDNFDADCAAACDESCDDADEACYDTCFAGCFGEDVGQCDVDGAACSAADDCCSGACVEGVCGGAVACAPDNEACSTDTDCCGGACAEDGFCGSVATCAEKDAQCFEGAECCSGECADDGFCN